MTQDRTHRIVDTLTFLGVIPKDAVFQIEENHIVGFMDVYKDITRSKGRYASKSNQQLARKIAGVNLLKTNLERGATFKEMRSGLVYMIENPTYPDHYKIGMTIDLPSRLNQYQIYDPLKRFRVVKYDFVLDRRHTEKKILKHPDISLETGEWVLKENAKELFELIV
jgi:hypothetical protein